MTSGKDGSAKGGTNHKPFSDFLLRNTSCPGCGKRVDLTEIRENVCPSCGSVLNVTNNMIRDVHEAAYRYAKEKKEKKKEKESQKKSGTALTGTKETKGPEKVKSVSEYDDKIEIGTFIFIGKKNREYMVIEKKKKSYLCLPIIRDTDFDDGQYVQRAYRDRLVVISEKAGIAPDQITGIKARLAVQHLNAILEKYHNYIPPTETKGKKKTSPKKSKQDPNNYRRSGDGLYDGNAWSGLAMTTTHVKIYRG